MLFWRGIFAGAGYIVKSNREHGDGRSDVEVQDYDGDRIAIFDGEIFPPPGGSAL